MPTERQSADRPSRRVNLRSISEQGPTSCHGSWPPIADRQDALPEAAKGTFIAVGGPPVACPTTRDREARMLGKERMLIKERRDARAALQRLIARMRAGRLVMRALAELGVQVACLERA